MRKTLVTQFIVIMCSFALLTATLPAQDLKGDRLEESASFLSEPPQTILLARADAGPFSTVQPSKQESPFRRPPVVDTELTPELRNLFSSESVRSEEFIARLSAAGATPTVAAPAPAPQGSGSDRKVAGWVKALIIIGGTGAGVAIFRAVIGADEDLAPFSGQ